MLRHLVSKHEASTSESASPEKVINMHFPKATTMEEKVAKRDVHSIFMSYFSVHESRTVGHISLVIGLLHESSVAASVGR